jgi:hypothetical protein
MIDRAKASPVGNLSVCHEAIPIVTAAELLQKPQARRRAAIAAASSVDIRL